MKRFLLHTLKIILLALLLAEGLSFFLMSQLANANFYKTGVANRQYGTTYDYIVLGSSRALTTINTRQIDDSLGANGYNFSLDDTGVETHELMLRHLKACGIRFKTLVLAYDVVVNESDKAGVVSKTINDNDHRFLPFINRDYVYDYFKERSHKGGSRYTASRYFPFITLGYFNVELLWPAVVATFKKEYYYRSDARGNFSYPMNRLEDVSGLEKNEASLNLQSHYLQQIQKFCRQENIKLVLYYSPFFNRTIQVKAGWADDGNARFLNYADLLKDPSLFYDRQHVNDKGRRAVTSQLMADAGTWLKQR